MTRMGLHEYFMDIAYSVASRSTCLHRKIGAILVIDKHIISTGYNGVPRNINHCSETGCIKDKNSLHSGEGNDLCRAVHAESNAICMAAYHGIPIKDSILYCTNKPCFSCSKLIINSGIKKVIYDHDYPDDRSLMLFKQAKIDFISMTEL